jgi:hypothetical protein
MKLLQHIRQGAALRSWWCWWHWFWHWRKEQTTFEIKDRCLVTVPNTPMSGSRSNCAKMERIIVCLCLKALKKRKQALNSLLVLLRSRIRIEAFEKALFNDPFKI